MTVRSTLSLLGVVVAVAGCGKPVGTTPSANERTQPAPAQIAGTPVNVTMKEWSITVSPASVKAGNVTLKMRNEGAQPHGIYIDGPGVQRKAPLTDPGDTTELTLDMPTGEFNLVDFVKNNESKHNMTATLTVK
jgi:hypothetical protein